MKSFILPALRIITVLGLLYIIWSQKAQINTLKKENDKILIINHQYDSIKTECDSLKIKIFPDCEEDLNTTLN